MTRPSLSLNWYEPGASGMVPAGGRWIISLPIVWAGSPEIRKPRLQLTSTPARYPATYPFRGRHPRAGRPGCPHRPPIGAPNHPRGFNMLRLQSPLPDRYTSATPEDIVAWIGAARAELGDRVFILGHHYQR